MPLCPPQQVVGKYWPNSQNKVRERARTTSWEQTAAWVLAVNICLKVLAVAEVCSTVSYCWVMKKTSRQINTCTQICKHITKHAYTTRLQFHFLASCTRQKQTITNIHRHERLATDSPSRHLNKIRVRLGELPLEPLTLQKMLFLCSECFHKLKMLWTELN